MECQYPGCHKETARYFICWDNLLGEGCGYVCAGHDKFIGRTNLIKCGFSLEEAIEWESANKITLDTSSQVARWNKNLTGGKGNEVPENQVCHNSVAVWHKSGNHAA